MTGSPIRYAALNRTGLLWAPTIHCESYNVLHATQYMNGGLMVFKTHALRDSVQRPALLESGRRCRGVAGVHRRGYAPADELSVERDDDWHPEGAGDAVACGPAIDPFS